MNLDQFQEYADEAFEGCKDLLFCKMKDYADQDDALAHFHEQAVLAETSTERIWLVFFNKHYIAMKKLLKGGISSSGEDLAHRIQDMINYLVILAAMQEEAEMGFCKFAEELDKRYGWAYDTEDTPLEEEIEKEAARPISDFADSNITVKSALHVDELPDNVTVHHYDLPSKYKFAATRTTPETTPEDNQ